MTRIQSKAPTRPCASDTKCPTNPHHHGLNTIPTNYLTNIRAPRPSSYLLWQRPACRLTRKLLYFTTREPLSSDRSPVVVRKFVVIQTRSDRPERVVLLPGTRALWRIMLAVNDRLGGGDGAGKTTRTNGDGAQRVQYWWHSRVHKPACLFEKRIKKGVLRATRNE